MFYIVASVGRVAPSADSQITGSIALNNISQILLRNDILPSEFCGAKLVHGTYINLNDKLVMIICNDIPCLFKVLFFIDIKDNYAISIIIRRTHIIRVRCTKVCAF